MLYFVLQLKILIYAFFSLCAFICQRLVSYTHFTRRYQMQNDWEFLLLMLDFRLFVKIGRIGVCFHHWECWWLISWILNSENQFFFVSVRSVRCRHDSDYFSGFSLLLKWMSERKQAHDVRIPTKNHNTSHIFCVGLALHTVCMWASLFLSLSVSVSGVPST